MPAVVASCLVMLAAQAASWSDLSPVLTGGVVAFVALLVMRLLTRAPAEAGGATASLQAPLVAEVLPVWQRQIERARHQSEESVGSIMASFGMISARLEQAIQANQGEQEGMGHHHLDAPPQGDRVYAKLDAIGEAVNDLRQMALQLKHAHELTDAVGRQAAQLAQVADAMVSRTQALDLELQALRHQTSDMDQASRALQEAGAAVSAEFESVLVGFQAQDRLSQMLSCVTDDIQRLTQWLEQGGDLSAAQAGEWLARLDESYTMEEQRSEHHGNTSIQRETAVEFF